MMIPARIAEKFEIDGATGCWLWTASLDKKGYGQVWYNGTIRRAHRVVFECVREGIDNNLVIDHRCMVKHCVNPDHLDQVTQAENMSRVPRSPECRKGHSMASDNVYYNSTNGGRQCRACKRLSDAAVRARRRS